MQNEKKCDTLKVQNEKVICPVCNRGVLQYGARRGMVMRNVPRKCKRCGQVTIVNIDLSLSQ